MKWQFSIGLKVGFTFSFVFKWRVPVDCEIITRSKSVSSRKKRTLSKTMSFVTSHLLLNKIRSSCLLRFIWSRNVQTMKPEISCNDNMQLLNVYVNSIKPINFAENNWNRGQFDCTSSWIYVRRLQISCDNAKWKILLPLITSIFPS